MIKILIIDDDPIKLGHITETIRTIPELKSEDVSVATNLVEARDVLSKRFFDLLILDIVLPAIPDAKPTAESGVQFVRELRLSKTIIKPAQVIGLTAYEEAISGADTTFQDELWHVIKYDAGSSAWRNRINSKIVYLLKCKRDIGNGANANYDFDLAIITALWKPEMKAVLNLPLIWDERIIANDGTKYFVGKTKEGVRPLQVVAASCSQMGIASATVLSLKLISHFRPRYIAMCGIAAGVKSAGLNLGDILIVEQSWDYESGKRRNAEAGSSVLIPDPHHIPISSELRDQFSECVGNAKYVAEIQKQWLGKKPTDPLKAVLGPVGSGAAVVEDKELVQNLSSHARKLIGIEMETYGVFYAAENCCKPRPKPISVKAVVDFADEKKDDSFHEYAAYTSANFLWNFAVDHLALASSPSDAQ